MERAGPGRWLIAAVYQLGVAVYGGYFGAGIGILMLAALGFLGVAQHPTRHGPGRSSFGICINGGRSRVFHLPARGRLERRR